MVLAWTGVGMNGGHLETNASAANDRASWDGSLALRTIEQMSAAVCVLRSFDAFSMRMVHANRAFCRLTGYAAADLAGESLEMLYGPATCQQTLLRIREETAAGRPHHGELTQYRKDGAPIRVEWRSDPIVDDGRSLLWVTVQREIHRQSERDSSNAVRWQEICDSMRHSVVHQVAAGTIHDSLQPLYAIGNLAAACRNTLRAEGELDKQKLVGWLDAITSTVVDAKDLLLRLKKFDGSTPKKTTARLDDVIRPMALMLANELKHAEAQIELDLDCDGSADVDVSQLRQVLAELVFNASDALEESRAESRCVKVRTWCEDGFCHVSVDDNGPGIATDKLGEVFKPFYSDRSGRPGLGLSFCKSAIAAHGGAIVAKSNVTGGVCVHFKIPKTPSSSNVQ